MALCSPAPHQSSRGSATPRTPGAPVARPAGGPASLSAPRPPREALSRNTGPEPGPLQGPRSSQTGKPRHTTAGRGCESRHGVGRAERAPLEPGGGLGHLTTSGAVLQLLHKLDKETLCLRPPRPCLPAPGLAPPKPLSASLTLFQPKGPPLFLQHARRGQGPSDPQAGPPCSPAPVWGTSFSASAPSSHENGPIQTPKSGASPQGDSEAYLHPSPPQPPRVCPAEAAGFEPQMLF